MVLHVGDEDERTKLVRELAERREVLGEPQPEHPLQLVHHRGHPRALGDDHVVRGGVDVGLEDRLRLLVRAGHRHAGGAGLGVGVAHQRAELFDQPPLDGPVERPLAVQSA